MLIGLSKRSGLCKICSVFDENTLNQITIDILLQRRTWVEIGKYYSKFLPKGVSKITDVNIRNHKRHSDPTLIAEDILKRKGGFTTEGDVISKLYAEIFQEGMNMEVVLAEIYRERLKNLKTLQELLEEKKKEFFMIKSEESPSLQKESRGRELQKQIISMTKNIDSIHDNLQEILLRESSINKGINVGGIQITQNYINVFQGHLKGFLEEIIPYLLLQIFKENSQLGREVVQYISNSMDRHLAPAIEESKLLNNISK